ncbi:MAG TPA: hypothetical protein VGL89_08940 [Candidatus Koribacter sp.]|jgi:hypothetical protein
MNRRFLSLLSIAVLSTTAFAAPRASSTARERVKFVRVARNLELKPLAFDSVQKRQWATEFLVKAPDLHLELCEGVLAAPLQSADRNYNSQLSLQFMVSSAAYMIQHPSIKDPVKIQTAGVEGTLKAYQSILKVDKTARFAFLDHLVQQNNQGELEKYVASVSDTCGPLDEKSPKPKRRLIP